MLGPHEMLGVTGRVGVTVSVGFCSGPCVSVCLSVSVWLYVIFAVRSQDVSLKKQKSHLLLLYSCNPLSSDQIRSDEAQTIIMQN